MADSSEVATEVESAEPITAAVPAPSGADKVIATPAAEPVLESAEAEPAPVLTAEAAEVVVAEAAPARRKPGRPRGTGKTAVQKLAPAAPDILAVAPATIATTPKPRKTKVKVVPASANAVTAPVKPARKLRSAATKVAKAVVASPVPTKAARVAAPRPAVRKTVRAIGAGVPKSKQQTVSTAQFKQVPSKQSPFTGATSPTLSQLKDKLMAKTIPTDFTATIQSVVADLQTKAQSAYEKSTAAFTEANEFAKGNVEALVESSKILASGVQEMSTTIVADTRTAFESMTAEVKELAAAKSPTDFFQLQSTLIRKHFDGVVAHTSKNSEAVLKLVSEAMSPLSSRVTLAVEKVSKAA